MSLLPIVLCAAALGIASTSGRCDLVVVPDQFPSINDALAAIGEFDTVLVRAGTYAEDIGLGYGGHPNSFRLLSESGPEVTIVLGRFSSGISELPSDMVLRGFTFRGSRGVYFHTSGQSRIVVGRCIVEDNASGGSGLAGGINILAASPLSQPWVVVDSCLIRNNYGDRGGGIYLYSGGLIRNTVISGNSAVEGGGGLYVASGGWIELDGCTIAGNHLSGPSSPHVGAGIEAHGIHSWHRLHLSRTIVAANTGGHGVSSDLPTPPVTYCIDSWGNEAGNYFGFPDPTGTNGNISLDPEFCDPEIGDYSLRTSSPCAPDNSPPGCGLIGSLPIACGALGVHGQAIPALKPKLMVFPNPAAAVVEFSIRGLAGGALIEIYDSRGVVVSEFRASANPVLWMPSSDIPSGIYFARATSTTQSLVAKFLLLK